MATRHVSTLLSERELLIRYVLYSAPVEVRLSLPAGASNVEGLDLSGVDVAALVRRLHGATISGAAIEVDLTDCPVRRRAIVSQHTGGGAELSPEGAASPSLCLSGGASPNNPLHPPCITPSAVGPMRSFTPTSSSTPLTTPSCGATNTATHSVCASNTYASQSSANLALANNRSISINTQGIAAPTMNSSINNTDLASTVGSGAGAPNPADVFANAWQGIASLNPTMRIPHFANHGYGVERGGLARKAAASTASVAPTSRGLTAPFSPSTARAAGYTPSNADDAVVGLGPRSASISIVASGYNNTITNTNNTSSNAISVNPSSTCYPAPHDDDGAGSEGDAYDPGDDEGPLAGCDALGEAHVQFIPSCVTSRPRGTGANDSSSRYAGTSTEDCPRGMEYDGSASVCGDLFEPFENAGQPFFAWVYDVVLCASGMLVGDGSGDDAAIEAVLEGLRKELGLSEEDHATSYATFFPSAEVVRSAYTVLMGRRGDRKLADAAAAAMAGSSSSESVRGGGGAASSMSGSSSSCMSADSAAASIPPALANATFASIGEFRALRDALPSDVRTAIVGSVSASPSYMAVCLQRSGAHAAARSRHQLLGRAKASSIGEAKGQFPSAIKALALAGVMSLGVRLEEDVADGGGGGGAPPRIVSQPSAAHQLVAQLLIERLGIPSSVVGLCRVHALMIAQRRMNDEGGCGAAGSSSSPRRGAMGVRDGIALQGAFLALVGAAMEEHVTSRGGVVTAGTNNSNTDHTGMAGASSRVPVDLNYHRYRNYVFESTLQLSVVPIQTLAVMSKTFTSLLSHSTSASPTFGHPSSTVATQEADVPSHAAALRAAVKVLALTWDGACESNIVPSMLDVREVRGLETNADAIFRYTLSELLSDALYTRGAMITEDAELSTHRALMGIASLHAGAVKFCTPLVPHVPAVATLVLRAAYRLMGYAMRRRWGAMLREDTLPDNFTTGMQSIREAVETVLKNTRWSMQLGEGGASASSDPSSPSVTGAGSSISGASSPAQSPASPLTGHALQLMGTNRRAVEESFGWLVPFFDMRYEKVATELKMREAEMCRLLTPTPDTNRQLHDKERTNATIQELFVLWRQLFDPLPSAIVPNPGHLYMQFMSSTLNQLSCIALGVCSPYCISQMKRNIDAKLPTSLQPAEAAGFLKTWRLSIIEMEELYPALLQVAAAKGITGDSIEEGLTQRLNTLKSLFNEALRFLAEVRQAYRGLKAVIGCPDLPALGLFEDQIVNEQSHIVTAIRDVCDCLAIQQVKALYYVPKVAGVPPPADPKRLLWGFSHLYVTDLDHYKFTKVSSQPGGFTLKRKHSVDKCSMSAIVDALDGSLPTMLGRVSDINCRNRIIASCHRYFMSAYAEVLLNGGDQRFYDATHCDSILTDMDEVIEFFATTAPQETIVTDTAANELGLMLRRVVSDLFTKETHVLLVSGNPSYPDCPELGLGTPMCRLVIRCVMAHRKDKEAKNFAEKNPPLPQ